MFKTIIKKTFGSKTVDIVLVLIFLIGVSSYIFKSQIGLFVWGIRYKSPVEWNNISIKFPKGMIYRIYNKSIQLFYWEDPKGFLWVRNKKLTNKSKENLIKFFKYKKLLILEDREANFKGFKGFIISYTDSTSETYNKGIYIIPKNICILYEGKRGNYEDFKEVIDGIEFLSKN